MNLQDLLLTEARKQQIPVTIYLIGGHQMKGLVVGTDTCVVMLNCEGKQILIYKHAISTITPIKKLLLPELEETMTQQ